MKKYIPHLLILILSYFICLQYNDIETLKSKVIALDYKTDNIKKKDFPTVGTDYKETFYLTQLSNSTTLILSVIGFTLVFAGFSSYYLINERFALEKSSVEQQITNIITESQRFRMESNTSQNTFRNEISVKLSEYETNYKKYENRHNDFEFKLTDFQANESLNKFYFNYDKEDFEMALYYSLNALSDFSRCYYIDNELNDEDYKEGVLEVVSNTLELLNKHDSFKVSVQFKKLIYNSTIVIRSLNNEDIHKKLSLLDTKITYENRERF